MASNSSLRRYRNGYAKLLRLYPKRFRERFAEGMEQTFHDLCRERVESGRGLASFVLWIYFETAAGIMREQSMVMRKKKVRIVNILLATMLILMVPLVAMQFSDEMNWDGFDFAVAAVLLISAGLTFDLIAKRSQNLAYQTGVGVAVVTGLILTWINLAVGIIGNEEHPANLMYFAVLLVGLIGAIVARFQSRGMSRALVATAIAQLLVPVIALMVWQPPLTIGVLKVLVFNMVFAMLFAGAALLFRLASRNSAAVQPLT